MRKITYCPKCGTEQMPGARFCQSCGGATAEKMVDDNGQPVGGQWNGNESELAAGHEPATAGEHEPENAAGHESATAGEYEPETTARHESAAAGEYEPAVRHESVTTARRR